jgi:transcriptional regulator with XRE-family HTH domain
MVIGDRLRSVREAKNLSQGDIERRTGLLRCYVSRIENGHTVPSLENLEKLARAMEMQLYQLLYDGHQPPISTVEHASTVEWGRRGKEARYLRKLTACLEKMNSADRTLIFEFVKKIAKRRRKK